jgi:hypothetical protein
MVLTTVMLAAAFAGSPATHGKKLITPTKPATPAHVAVGIAAPNNRIALDLHPMTDDEKRTYPGRERWDKTEWYEAQFKSAKVVTMPEHVDEWNNGGLEQG